MQIWKPILIMMTAYMAAFIGLSACTPTAKAPYQRTVPIPTSTVPAPDLPPSTDVSEKPVIDRPEPETKGPIFTTNPPSEISTAEGALVTFTVVVDKASVSFSSQCLGACPSDLTISADGQVSWTTSFVSSGIYDVRIAATDSEGLVGVSQYVRIRVANVNRKPIVTSVSISESGASYTCDITVKDEDIGDIVQIFLTWKVNSLDPISGPAPHTRTIQVSSLGKAGDSITCEAVAKDSNNAVSEKVTSSPIIVPNSPPIIISSGVVSKTVKDGQSRVVPESPAGRVFKVGDEVVCAVSLTDREGGDGVTIQTMELLALPVGSDDGSISSTSGSQSIVSLAPDLIVFNSLPPLEYLRQPYSSGLLFGIGYSSASFKITKALAHRPLTCKTTIKDGENVATATNFASRVSNSSPVIGVPTIIIDPAEPNFKTGGVPAARSGGLLRCDARYSDADGDSMVPSVSFDGVRSDVKRTRVSPSVSWTQTCDSAGACVVSGSYSLRPWTSINAGSQSELSDIRGDVMSCRAEVVDVTSFGSQSAGRKSGGLTVSNSPPSITLSSGSPNQLTQTIHTGESYGDLIFNGLDVDGDIVTFVLNQEDCGSRLITSKIVQSESVNPTATISQVGSVPPMAYPHKDRDCFLSVGTSSLSSTNLPEESPKLKISLNVPNRAPRLFCGTSTYAESVTGFPSTPTDTETRYLATSTEDIYGSPSQDAGQQLGKTELGDSLSESSIHCAVMDLDGSLSGTETPSIVIGGASQPSSSDESFEWTTTTGPEASSCSYSLELDAPASLRLSMPPIGIRHIFKHSLSFAMGVKECSGAIIVSDGPLKSNSQNFMILPKITVGTDVVKLNPYCEIEGGATTKIIDPSLQLPSPALASLQSLNADKANDFPTVLSVAIRAPLSPALTFGEIRTSPFALTPPASVFNKPDSVETIMSSPNGFSFQLLSGLPSSSQTTPLFIEDMIGTTKSMLVTLAVAGTAKNTTSNEPTTTRKIQRELVFSKSVVVSSDVGPHPRKVSFSHGLFGGDGRQIVSLNSCPSESSCANKREASISAGEAHTCFVTLEGRVKCFGSNSRFQTGADLVSDKIVSEVRLANLSSSECSDPGVTTCPLADVSAVSVGVAHSCARMDDGRVACWGDNQHGQLGRTPEPNSSFDPPPQPLAYFVSDSSASQLKDIVQIASGPNHTCALSQQKEVYCWGANPTVSYPLTDIPSTTCGGTNRCVLYATKIPDLDNVESISAGGFGALAANMAANIAPGVNYVGGTTCVVLTDGSIKCFGDSSDGIRGINDPIIPPSPIDALSRRASLIEDFMMTVFGKPTPFAPKTKIRGTLSVIVGRFAACSLSMTSTSCWGGKDEGAHSGALSQGGRLTSLGIKTAPSGTVTEIQEPSTAAARVIGTGFSCDITSGALATSGVRCVGYNHFMTPNVTPLTYGALGTGSLEAYISRDDEPSFVQDAALAPIKNVVAITAGAYHACAITSNGQVSCWGSNFAGQMGDMGPALHRSRVIADADDASVKSCSSVLNASFKAR